MEDILTTQEFLQVLKEMNFRMTKQGLLMYENKGTVTAYFKHPKFKLWRVDHIKAFIASLSKKRKREYNEEDLDNYIKFVQSQRDVNN